MHCKFLERKFYLMQKKIHPVQFLPWRRFGFTARKSPSRARSDCPSFRPVGRGRLDSRSVECLNGLAAAEGSVGVVGVKT